MSVCLSFFSCMNAAFPCLSYLRAIIGIFLSLQTLTPIWSPSKKPQAHYGPTASISRGVRGRKMMGELTPQVCIGVYVRGCVECSGEPGRLGCLRPEEASAFPAGACEKQIRAVGG